jgi:hypothetical protein
VLVVSILHDATGHKNTTVNSKNISDLQVWVAGKRNSVELQDEPSYSNKTQNAVNVFDAMKNIPIVGMKEYVGR